MTGIGFLCAGTIIQQGNNVHGLTTAAAIWCVAAIGLAAGFGLYSLTIFVTCIVLAALWILDYVEAMLPRTRHRMLVIRRAWGPDCLEQTIQKLIDAGLRISQVSFDRSEDLRASTSASVQHSSGRVCMTNCRMIWRKMIDLN